MAARDSTLDMVRMGLHMMFGVSDQSSGSSAGSDPEATQPIGGEPTEHIPGPPPPPTATRPLYTGGPPPPPRGRQALIYALVLLVGLGGGFALAQAFGGDDEIPTEDFVLFENASSIFPVRGGQFTGPFDDPANETCDKEAFKRMLRNQPDRFEAWLSVHELTASEFDPFVDRLVPRVLDRPTPVTNHGCITGNCPFELDSVLAAGTLVLADPDTGEPVVRCRCGNPLKDPKCPPNCEEQPTPTPTITPPPTTPPVTEPPRTAPPTTAPPTTEPPVTEPPRTEPPTEPPSQTIQPPA